MSTDAHNAEVNLRTDGRDIDTRLATLAGQGAGQIASPYAPDRTVPGAGQQVYDRNPSDRSDGPETYYGLPIVKAPPWGWPVPTYIVLGGVSGASAALAAATQFDPAATRLVTAARWLAFGSGAAGAGLLLKDLGRPERFINMLRVARPTSPMSMGVYILSASVGTSAAASLLGNRRGLFGWSGRVAGTVAGVTGIPLSGYTAVLLGTTAMPGWNVGLATLPPLFMSSAVATAGSVLTAVPLPPGAQRSVDVYRTVGQVAELAAETVHERTVAQHPPIAAAYKRQRTWKVGKWLTLGSLLATLVAPLRRSMPGRVLIAVLGVAGSTATKLGVFSAGMATAADPVATIEQQRSS